jgi:hypothetical protein
MGPQWGPIVGWGLGYGQKSSAHSWALMKPSHKLSAVASSGTGCTAPFHAAENLFQAPKDPQQGLRQMTSPLAPNNPREQKKPSASSITPEPVSSTIFEIQLSSIHSMEDDTVRLSNTVLPEAGVTPYTLGLILEPLYQDTPVCAGKLRYVRRCIPSKMRYAPTTSNYALPY